MPVTSIKEPEEREFVVVPGASIYMVSKKDLNSVELETVRTSRSPTTVYVKQLDLFVKVMLLEETPAVLSLGNSVRIMGIHTTGSAVENHNSPKKVRKLIAIFQTVYHSLSLVYRRILPRHLHLLLQCH